MRLRIPRILPLEWVAAFPLLGCTGTPIAPTHPQWADVQPILRGECNSCHGWTAGDVYNAVYPYRFDFFDITKEACGDAALAIDAQATLAGSPSATVQINQDVVAQNGAHWPRMPPQPSPSLPDWEVETLQRWSAQPVKGPPPTGNRPPTVAVSQLPSMAGNQLAFTTIIDDPDGDSVIGVVEVNGVAFPMNHPGAFAVHFDSSTWAPGEVSVKAVVCDGWSNMTYDIGPVQIQH